MISKFYALSTDLGFVYNIRSQQGIDDDDTFSIGNPFVAGHYVSQEGCTEIRTGMGVFLSPSILSTDSHRKLLWNSSIRGAGLIRGMEDPWLWLTGFSGLAIPISAKSYLRDNLILQGDMAIVFPILFSVRQGGIGTFHPLMVFTVAGQLGYRIGLVTLGARIHSVLSLWWLPPQISAHPFVEINFEEVYLYSRATMNFLEDEWSDDHAKTWGVMVGTGIRL